MVLGGKWGVILVILEWCVCVRAPIGRKSKLYLYVPEMFARKTEGKFSACQITGFLMHFLTKLFLAIFAHI